MPSWRNVAQTYGLALDVQHGRGELGLVKLLGQPEERLVSCTVCTVYQTAKKKKVCSKSFGNNNNKYKWTG
jgi:hypothetical protein